MKGGGAAKVFCWNLGNWGTTYCSWRFVVSAFTIFTCMILYIYIGPCKDNATKHKPLYFKFTIQINILMVFNVTFSAPVSFISFQILILAKMCNLIFNILHILYDSVSGSLIIWGDIFIILQDCCSVSLTWWVRKKSRPQLGNHILKGQLDSVGLNDKKRQI